jgi:uncharacterized repeat protein (TIGR01451 family)
MASRQRRRRQERRQRHAQRRGWSTSRSVITGAGLTAGAVLGIGGTAQAADFTVTNLSDGAAPGPAGSLRKAITDANANPGADTIIFNASLSGSIFLAGPSIPITEALTIDGPGADTLAVDAYYGTSRIFTVNPATAGDPVTISGLTLAYGHTTGSGGAIFNDDAKLTVADSFLFGNSAGFTGIGGGAIADSGNYASGSETTVRNSTVLGNSATSGYGGGVGGGVQIGNVVNSTIAGNYALHVGGGFFSNDNGGNFQNSTVAFNEADGSGGGVASGSGGPATSFQNSIVGANTAGTSGPDLAGSDPFDAEFSLFKSTSGVTINSTVSGSNIVGVDPKLSHYLPYGGGSASVLVPYPDSPAIDQGMTAGGSTTDQRGEPRPLDLPSIANSAATGADGADMGAVEVTTDEASATDLTLSITDSPDPATVGDPLNYAFKVKNQGPNDATGVVLTDVIPLGLAFSSASGNCSVTGTDPDVGTYVSCEFGSIVSGATETATESVTPLAAAASADYVSTYGYVSADQGDPHLYDNSAYADTVVHSKPATGSPPPASNPPAPSPEPGVGAAIKQCKKKFHGKAKAKKRKKCIKKAKRAAAARAQQRFAHAHAHHSFTKRPRPPALEQLQLRLRPGRSSGL